MEQVQVTLEFLKTRENDGRKEKKLILLGHEGQQRFDKRIGCAHFGVGHDINAHNCSPL
jgi:hypothetical protein